MERQHTISAAQFFGMEFVSRITITIALNAQYAAGESLLDGILSYLLAMAVGVLLALPVWVLHRQEPRLSIGEAAVRFWGSLGKLVPLGYILYFLVMNGVSLALFQLFLLDNVNPDFPAVLILLVLVAVAVYGAWRGLETIARTSACVLVLLLLGTVLVFSLVARRFDTENLEPLLAGGPAQLLRGGALFLSRTSLFAEMAVLLPYVRGRKGLGFAVWMGSTSFYVGVLILLIAGCPGAVRRHPEFPSLCPDVHYRGVLHAAAGRCVYRRLAHGADRPKRLRLDRLQGRRRCHADQREIFAAFADRCRWGHGRAGFCHWVLLSVPVRFDGHEALAGADGHSGGRGCLWESWWRARFAGKGGKADAVDADVVKRPVFMPVFQRLRLSGAARTYPHPGHWCGPDPGRVPGDCPGCRPWGRG